MKANCWIGPNHVEVQDVPDPGILNDRDAIVKITSTAICGSDLHSTTATSRRCTRATSSAMSSWARSSRSAGASARQAAGRRPGGGAVPDRLRRVRCVPGRAVLAAARTPTPTPGWPRSVRPLGRRHLRLLASHRRLRRRAGASTRACRSPTSAREDRADLRDEQVLFLSDILPTGYRAAEMCDITPGDVVAVWGCGPVGQFAIQRAAARGGEGHRHRRAVPARHGGQGRYRRRSTTSRMTSRYTLLEMTGGRGPDKCIDAVGMESTPWEHADHGLRPGQAGGPAGDRPPVRAARGDPVAAAVAGSSRSSASTAGSSTSSPMGRS